MPRFLILPLKVLAVLGAAASLILGLYILTAWNSRVGSGVPGIQDTIKRMLLYAILTTSGFESLLLSGLGYSRVIHRKWSIVGAVVFGIIFLASLTTLLIFFGAYLKYDFRLNTW